MTRIAKVIRFREFSNLHHCMARIFHNSSGILVIVGFVVAFYPLAGLSAQSTAVARQPETAIEVVKAYLRATHARDFETAYRHISTPDRSVRDKNTYLRSEASLSGFALDVAKRLAAGMEVWVVEQKLDATKARLEVGYRIPTGEEITDFNADKLNTLISTEQTALMESLERLKKTGKMIAIEGRETFALILEQTGWKVFLNWASQQRVLIKAVQPRSGELAVTALRKDFLIKSEEPFQVDFKLTNRTDRVVVVKVNHIFEPRQIEKNIDMIACGSRLPFSLRPLETQEISNAYILRGNIQRKKPLEISYDFKVAPAAGGHKLAQSKGTTAQ
jgi:hypothetical protein